MDRNHSIFADFSAWFTVALRKESVDRNWALIWWAVQQLRSLSARRAWIEMFLSYQPAILPPVALRKESVDRNDTEKDKTIVSTVALRKESVDRNVM